MLLHIDNLQQPLQLLNCAELAPKIKNIFRDIAVNEIDDKACHVPQIILRKNQKGYLRESMWLKEPTLFRDPLDAVCDLTVDIIHAFVRDKPGSLCLHTAAVKFRKGLILFPSTYRSGKSILSMHLVSKGIPLYTDDALPITPNNNQAMVTTLLPRLRLPLPENVTPHFSEFIELNRGESNGRYAYIRLKKDLLPEYGTTAPIKGIILLERQEGVKANLEKTTTAEIVKKMILRNFARRNAAIDIVDRIYAIALESECYKLVYDNLDEAANYLIGKFN